MAPAYENHDADDQLVTVGNAADLPPVSMKVFQSIYNDITGKTEKLEKSFERAFQARMADFEQLHHKLSQACEQYDVKAFNVGVTVYHVNDTSETFSSFERFSLYNQSNTNAVESVVFTYNLLILLPKLGKPQSYELTIRVISGVAEKTTTTSFRIPILVLKLAADVGGSYSIKYVDYLVARNLATAVEGWFDALTTYEPPKWLQFVRKWSEYITPLTEYSIALFVLFLTLRVVGARLSGASDDLLHMAQLLLISASVLFISYRFGRYVGQKLYHTIYSIRDVGFVALNRGDEKAIASAEKANSRALTKGALAVGFEFIIAVAAHFTALALSH